MKKFYVLFIIFLMSCTNPFSTREPKKPELTNNLRPVNSLQNNRDTLLAKLQYAFREKNKNFYIECLADSMLPDVGTEFEFIPQQDAVPRLTGWTLQDEENYFNRLVSSDEIDDIRLQIYNVQDWVLAGSSQDTMQTRFSYQIEINFPTRQEIYEGQSIFKILRSTQSLWYIYFWEDLKLQSDQDNGTWSTLKADYR